MIKNKYSHWLPKLLNSFAVTVGRTIYYEDAQPTDRLRRHEEKHVEQYMQYGVLGYLTRYFFSYFKNRLRGMDKYEAYRNIPFEIEARAAELLGGEYE